MRGRRWFSQFDDLSFEASTAGQGIIKEFEETFAQWLGVKYAVSVSSGTFALYIALKAVGVGHGDEVIVPAYDWYAATAAVLHCNAIPIFSDIDERTYTLDPKSVAERISPNTKAIVATHLYGHPADMLELQKIAYAHNVFLIEDAAQALGAVYNGKKVGTWGDLACFSFGVGKVLSCGEGGIIATNSEELYERVISLCHHPLRQRWEGIVVNPFALKASINPLGAKFLTEQCRDWEKLLVERRRAFQKLNEVLTEINGVLLPVFVREGCLHGCYRFSPVVKEEKFRDKVVGILLKLGIPACRGLPEETLPNALRRALELGQLSWHPFPEKLLFSTKLHCPVSEQICRAMITLDWKLGRTSKGLASFREAILLTSERLQRKKLTGRNNERLNFRLAKKGQGGRQNGFEL